jgi:hypothetical protein
MYLLDAFVICMGALMYVLILYNAFMYAYEEPLKEWWRNHLWRTMARDVKLGAPETFEQYCARRKGAA